MTDAQEARLKELEDKSSAGTISAEEETVRVALLELDERTEEEADAQKALDDAEAANTNPAPDPVAEAQTALDDATTKVADAQTAYDDAEAALAGTGSTETTPTA